MKIMVLACVAAAIVNAQTSSTRWAQVWVDGAWKAVRVGPTLVVRTVNGQPQMDAVLTAGSKGEPGPRGEKGDPGEPATISIGSITTLESGIPATVTNVGTASAAKLNFALPKGERGPIGGTGPQGKFGETGLQGPVGPLPRIIPGGGVIVTGDPATESLMISAGIAVVPFARDSDVIVKPGPCVYILAKDGVAREGATPKEAEYVKTPSAFYVCTPTGTGTGMRWLKLSGMAEF